MNCLAASEKGAVWTARVGLAAGTFGDVVRGASFRGPSGQHMVAVGALGSMVYGMYLDPGSPTGYPWEALSTLPFGLVKK